MKNAAQAYLQTKVGTTDQGQLLLMLYDGALNFLQQARDKMLAKDYAAKGLLISKTIDIVTELSNTLNMEKGGTLAENLNNLYFLCTARLLQANLKMNVEQLDSVVSILSGLRSAYAQIIETPEAQKAAAQIAARMNTDASMSQRAAPIMAAPVAPGGAAGKVMARAAYGQQSAHGLAPQQAAPAPVSAFTSIQGNPAAAPAAVSATFAAPTSAVENTLAAPANPASPASSFSGNGAGPATAGTTAPVAAPATPPRPQAAAPVASPPAGTPEKAQGLGAGLGAGFGGGLGKRMSSYGKFAQGA